MILWDLYKKWDETETDECRNFNVASDIMPTLRNENLPSGFLSNHIIYVLSGKSPIYPPKKKKSKFPPQFDDN